MIFFKTKQNILIIPLRKKKRKQSLPNRIKTKHNSKKHPKPRIPRLSPLTENPLPPPSPEGSRACRAHRRRHLPSLSHSLSRKEIVRYSGAAYIPLHALSPWREFSLVAPEGVEGGGPTPRVDPPAVRAKRYHWPVMAVAPSAPFVVAALVARVSRRSPSANHRARC